MICFWVKSTEVSNVEGDREDGDGDAGEDWGKRWQGHKWLVTSKEETYA